MLEIDLRLESLHSEPQFAEIKQQIEKDIVQARTEVESLTFATLGSSYGLFLDTGKPGSVTYPATD